MDSPPDTATQPGSRGTSPANKIRLMPRRRLERLDDVLIHRFAVQFQQRPVARPPAGAAAPKTRRVFL